MADVRPPEPLDWRSQKVGAQWDDWLERMELYLELARFSTEGATPAEKAADLLKKQKQTFVYNLGAEGMKILKTIKIKDEAGNIVNDKDEQTLNMIKKALGDYCKPKRAIVLDRIKFLRMRQEEESFDQFMLRLRSASSSCSWQDVDEDAMILLQIVKGIRDKSVREALLREKDLTVTRAEDTCRAAEMSHLQSQEIDNEEEKEVENVAVVGGRRRFVQNCIYCGKKSHPRGKCPAMG